MAAGNGVSVGKRLGVQPTLARRVPAAGRNGKRLLTGERANVNAIIGKAMRPVGPGIGIRPGRKLREAYGDDAELVRRFNGEDLHSDRSHRKSVNFVERFRYNPQTGQRDLPREGLKTSRPRGRSLTASDKEYLGLPGGSGGGTLQGTSGSARGRLVDYPLNGNKRVRKAAPGTNGLGHAVPQQVGSSIKPQAPEQMGNTLKPVGGPKKNPAQAGGARMPRQNGGQRPTSFGKRRYDPEDERRHQQGALAATGILGGLELGRRGVREIQRDTRIQRGAPAALRPGPPPQRINGGWKDAKGKLRQANAQERIGEDMAYDIQRRRHAAKVEAHSRLASPKGVQVTRRSGGKLGAGLALVAAGGTLQAQRREPRWD